MRETIRRNSESADGARSAILASLNPTETEYCGLINALGRTAAEDLKAPSHVPPYDVALVDGYAVRAADTSGATELTPVALGVLSDSPTRRLRRLEPETVVKVRAGGWMPAGADAVLPAGRLFRAPHDPQVHVMREAAPGENVSPAGYLAQAGEVIVERGTLIGPGEMAAAGAAGIAGIAVTRRPRAAIVTTGEGVVDVADDLSSGQTRNAARYQLAGMALECGCELGKLAHVRDGRKGIESALSDCAACDATLIALDPGTGVEFAVEALAAAGEVVFERVRMSPGGTAAAFGTVRGRPVFVLTAESSLEVFEALVRPGLLAMMGRREVDRRRGRAEVTANLRLDPAYCHYLRAFTRCLDGRWTTQPVTPHESGAGKWAQPDSLIFVPENTPDVRRGQNVEVILLG